MYKIGEHSFDGKSWENLIQLCLKDRYDDEQYQKVPATVSGDHGLEGFTLKTGIAFQCYCPEKNYDNKKLYDEQRKKITRDLNKLKKFESEIQKMLGSKKIKEWHFITPEYTNKQLLKHCRKKENDILDKNLSIIDNNFKIIIKDYDDYKKEIVRYTQLNELKADIYINENVEYDWDNHLPKYIENLKRKVNKILPENCTKEDRNILLEKFNTHYNRGLKIIEKLEKDYPIQYEKFIRLKNNRSEKIQKKSILNRDDNYKFYERIDNELENHLKEQLGKYFGDEGLEQLAEHLISEWLLICQLEFRR